MDDTRCAAHFSAIDNDPLEFLRGGVVIFFEIRLHETLCLRAGNILHAPLIRAIEHQKIFFAPDNLFARHFFSRLQKRAYLVSDIVMEIVKIKHMSPRRLAQEKINNVICLKNERLARVLPPDTEAQPLCYFFNIL